MVGETSPRSLLRRAWEGWKRIGHALGQFQARLLLTVFYFVVLAPFAVALRCFADPLAIKPRTPRGWRDRPATPGDALTAASRQF
jgi:hypothetical protein